MMGITYEEPDIIDQLSFAAPADAIIVSDLHLGAENCQAKSITAFFQEILDSHHPTRRLIINGDVFDSIDFRRLKKTHWKVLSQIRHLSDKIEVVWIVGNHDGSAEIISHLLGVRVEEHIVLHSGGQRLLVIHGHQFDRFITHHPILTWLADCGYWLLQKIDRTHYVARLAKRRSKIFIRCSDKISAGAKQMAARLACHAAICGHTHRAQADHSSNIAYYNSGCWTENPPSYLIVEAGNVRVAQYDPAASLIET